ncbi:chemotaxis protein CheB [Skermanella stibiiresistens]|uniref:chemotaxis protein CheB n=1 Tax=Skermanella stibiiresistens TaxID=913326 RepID=UPI0018DBFA74|nr:chemotaxis protein CheB [Skermanella stibiiresistens]
MAGNRRDIIVIGASAGGVQALQALVAGLPPDFPAAILIVVHMTPNLPSRLASLLARAGPLRARNGYDGAPIEPGVILVAPPDHHMRVGMSGDGGVIALDHGVREKRARPAVDPLFRSAATAFGDRVIGVVLTGLLDDGSAGLAAVKRRGGIGVVQDPSDARWPDMPRNAMAATPVDFVVPLAGIADLLVKLVAGDKAIIPAASVNPLGCPACGAALDWNQDGARYRCPGGHDYTPESLSLSARFPLDASIAAVIGEIGSRIRLLRRLALDARSRGETAAAIGWDAEVDILRTAANALDHHAPHKN